MVERGYFSLGRVGGVSLRAHVLTILGALFFTGFRFEPGAWLGFFLLVLLHEVGHALVVRRYGLQVSSIDLHAFGGVCHWSGQATSWQRAVIAWGGVMAQALLLVVTTGIVAIVGSPHSAFVAQIVYVFTATNLWLIVLNLAPIPPLDGGTVLRHAVGMSDETYYNLARWSGILILVVINISVTRNIIGYVVGRACIPYAVLCDWISPHAFSLIFP